MLLNVEIVELKNKIDSLNVSHTYSVDTEIDMSLIPSPKMNDSTYVYSLTISSDLPDWNFVTIITV